MLQYGFLRGSVVKNPPANAGNMGSIPESGRSLEKEMATHSRILAGRTPWTEEPGELQSTGSKELDTMEHAHSCCDNNQSQNLNNFFLLVFHVPCGLNVHHFFIIIILQLVWQNVPYLEQTWLRAEGKKSNWGNHAMAVKVFMQKWQSKKYIINW